MKGILSYRAHSANPIRTQGVGHFVIYDDKSSDDPWSVLRKYAALGIVEVIDLQGHPYGGNRIQKANLNACFTSLRARHGELGLRWLLFTDIDEFTLSNRKGQLLTDVLLEKYKEAPCIEVGRTFYGSSFHHRRPPGLVTANYLLASHDFADGYPKLLANIYPEGGSAQQNVTQLYSVHSFVNQSAIGCAARNEVRDIRINHYLRYVTVEGAFPGN